MNSVQCVNILERDKDIEFVPKQTRLYKKHRSLGMLLLRFSAGQKEVAGWRNFLASMRCFL